MTQWSELKLHDGSWKCPIDGDCLAQTVCLDGADSEGLKVTVCLPARYLDWSCALAYRVEVKPVIMPVYVAEYENGAKPQAFNGQSGGRGITNLNLIKTGDEYTVEVVKPTEGETK